MPHLYQCDCIIHCQIPGIPYQSICLYICICVLNLFPMVLLGVLSRRACCYKIQTASIMTAALCPRRGYPIFLCRTQDESTLQTSRCISYHLVDQLRHPFCCLRLIPPGWIIFDHHQTHLFARCSLYYR